MRATVVLCLFAAIFSVSPPFQPTDDATSNAIITEASDSQSTMSTIDIQHAVPTVPMDEQTFEVSPNTAEVANDAVTSVAIECYFKPVSLVMEWKPVALGLLTTKDAEFDWCGKGHNTKGAELTAPPDAIALDFCGKLAATEPEETALTEINQKNKVALFMGSMDDSQWRENHAAAPGFIHVHVRS